MINKIGKPSAINLPGDAPKVICEFIGNMNAGNQEVSIAKLTSPGGWSDAVQRAQFHEYVVVLEGKLCVFHQGETTEVEKGESLLVPKNVWVRYSAPHEGGAEYIAVCVPAFSPKLVETKAD